MIPTSDWNKLDNLVFENEVKTLHFYVDSDQDLLKKAIKDIEITFDKYKIIFDISSRCCECYSVSFRKKYFNIAKCLNEGLNMNIETLQSVKKFKVNYKTRPVGMIDDSIFYIIFLDENENPTHDVIKFSNMHNGYYSHCLTIYYDDTIIFNSSL